MPEILNSPFPPGPVVEKDGVRFTLYSGSAEGVELCLFEGPEAPMEFRRLEMERQGPDCWTLHVPGLSVGTLYGFRLHGPYTPHLGHRFNPNKVVVDPYAPALGRLPVWHERLFGASPLKPETWPDPRNNADIAPLGRVTDTRFDWEEDRPPQISWQDMVIYETHVKGLTRNHPDIPPEIAGSYSALGSPPIIDHFKRLGVTSVELLPVHQKFDEWHCHHHGLTNYWGYSTLLYLAPDIRFALRWPEDPAREFKEMVKALHRAGLEVILDVVYNHTAEADHRGPTLSLRGIDNAAYYRLNPEDPGRYEDFTGCGNTLNLNHPATLTLILDSLRFWVRDMHVDGFRFDLGPTLGRGPDGDFDPEHPFFEAIADDPVLSRVKKIAEPWDLGPEGYRLSDFPKAWGEWNGQYRDVVRRFWRGEDGMTGLFARRLTGSEDIFAPKQRSPLASINMVTCHDGFTLRDLVSYNAKHNLENLENNQDGPSDNFSDAHGREGETDDPEILELRARQRRNLIATLMLSLGVPMISGGDEIGRTQKGNNNAWCQDNPVSWYDWNLEPAGIHFFDFCATMTALRERHPALRRNRFLTGEDQGNGRDVVWLHPSGREMTELDWDDPELKTVGAWLQPLPEAPEPPLLVLFHAEKSICRFLLPGPGRGRHWVTCIDTHSPETPQVPGKNFELTGPALAVLESLPRMSE